MTRPLPLVLLLLVVGCQRPESFHIWGMCYDCDVVVSDRWSPRSIQRAVDTLPDNGIICFRPGRYRRQQWPRIHSNMTITGLPRADGELGACIKTRIPNPTCPEVYAVEIANVHDITFAEFLFDAGGKCRG